MNRIIIKGRLTKDPELKTTNSGKNVCNFDVAVGRNFNHEIADFFECTVWNEKAEFICKNFGKGKEILIEGEMQSEKFTDKNGNKRTSWKINVDRIEFCGDKKEDDNVTHSTLPTKIDDLEDDLPF